MARRKKGPAKLKWVDGKPVKAYTDGQHRREQKRAAEKFAADYKKANIRAKYGERGKPAPVVVKFLDGSPTTIKDQSQLTRKKAA